MHFAVASNMMQTEGSVSLLVGQCGIQVGDTIFDELSTSFGEQGKDGSQNSIFFDENKTARAILVDTEAKVVASTFARSRARNWKYFNGRDTGMDDVSVVRQGGAANNWAYGYRDAKNKVVAEQATMRVRKQVESMDRLCGFNIVSSAAGGTGSGVGTKLNEDLRDIYRTIPVVHFVVLPFEAGEVAVQSLNSILSLSHIMQNEAGGTVVLRNDSAYSICKRNGIFSPNLDDLNKSISRDIASLFLASGRIFYRDCIPHLWSQNQAFPFVELSSVPQTSDDGVQFNNDSWNALDKELSRRFKACKFPVSYSSCAFLHGPDAHNSLLLHKPKWLMTPTWRNYISWKCVSSKKPWRGYSRSCTVASNSASILEPLDRILTKSKEMIRIDAYLHQYRQHGIQKIDFCDSVLKLERVVSCYSDLVDETLIPPKK